MHNGWRDVALVIAVLGAIGGWTYQMGFLESRVKAGEAAVVELRAEMVTTRQMGREVAALQATVTALQGTVAELTVAVRDLQIQLREHDRLSRSRSATER